MPKVSICIPAYNAASTLRETVESVLSQEFRDFEILLQDNASTDKTWEVMLELAKFDPRIEPRKNSTNLGMLGNWNEVFSRAKSDYVLLLSADDCLGPGFLSKSVMTLEDAPDLVQVSCDHWLMFSSPTKKFQRARRIKINGGVYSNHQSLVLLKNPFSINFTLFNRRNLEAVLHASRPFRHFMTCDYDLHIRIALSGRPVKYLSERLASYRVHDGNLSKQRRRMTRQALLTVLSHKGKLRKSISTVYRFTLLRFLIRAVVFPLRGSAWDSRLVRLAYGRLFESNPTAGDF